MDAGARTAAMFHPFIARTMLSPAEAAEMFLFSALAMHFLVPP